MKPIAIALALMLGIPVVIAATIVATPLWRWLESAYGIEAIGHSGPAPWCYLAIAGLLVPLVIAILTIAASRRSRRERER